MLNLAARRVPQLARRYVPARSFITLKDHKYTTVAEAKGTGRNGKVTSESLELDLRLPKELGGSGGGENPEQLFAMGYASCLLGAIQAAARTKKKSDMAKNAVVTVKVHIGEPTDRPGFGIAVDIKVAGVDDEILKAGHDLCPYSRALQHGAQVNISKAD
ncbi:OsmC/Ohr family [Mycena floridula]|nr:OsmC/Ohr family [Mycena floridula]